MGWGTIIVTFLGCAGEGDFSWAYSHSFYFIFQVFVFGCRLSFVLLSFVCLYALEGECCYGGLVALLELGDVSG